MSDERIEVKPQKNGYWKVSGDSESYETRKDAIEAAYERAGREPLYNAKGESRGYGDPHTSVVLLRLDGSVYGELAAAPGTPGSAQQVEVTPAGEASEARED